MSYGGYGGGAPPSDPWGPPTSSAWGGPGVAQPPSYEVAMDGSRPRGARRRRERLGIPLHMAGAALIGIGILLVGISWGLEVGLGYNGGLTGQQRDQQELADENLTWAGVDVAGGGIVLLGIGMGLNVAARFEQNEELGRRAS